MDTAPWVRWMALVAVTAVVGLLGCEDPGPNAIAPDTGLLDIPTINTDGSSSPDGTSTPDGTVGNDAVADGAQPDLPGPDGTVTPDAGPDAGPPDAVTQPDVIGTPDGGGPVTTYYGGILLAEVDSEFVNTAVAGARFTTVPLPEPEQDFGECGVSYVNPDSPAPPAFGFDAGTITIPATVPPVVLTPVNEGAAGTGYSSSLSDSQEDLLPTVAALLTFSGAGGADIGAFSLVVQVPEPISITSPNVTGLGTNVSKSSPLTVTWPALNGDQVLISLSPLTSDLIPEPTDGQTMACVLEGDSGSFTIPVNALAAMGGGNHAIAITRLKSNTGTDSGGASVSATVTRSSVGIVILD